MWTNNNNTKVQRWVVRLHDSRATFENTMSFACLRVQFFENTMSFPCRGVLRSQTPSAYSSKYTAAQRRVRCEICAKFACSQTLPPRMGAKRTIDLYRTGDQARLHPRPNFLEIRVGMNCIEPHDHHLFFCKLFC